MHTRGYTLQLLGGDVTSRKIQNIHSLGIRMPASHQIFITVCVNKYVEWGQRGETENFPRGRGGGGCSDGGFILLGWVWSLE